MSDVDISEPADGEIWLRNKDLPLSYTLSELCDKIVDEDVVSLTSNGNAPIRRLASCLHCTERLVRGPDDSENVTRLSIWLSKAVLPEEIARSKDLRLERITIRRDRINIGLHALRSLSDFLPQAVVTTFEVLLALIACTSPFTSWTTPSSCAIARDLLSRNATGTLSSEFIVDYLLQRIIRPLFTQKSRTVTPAGRKVISSSLPPPRVSVTLDEDNERPWRYEKPYTITLLYWIVENIPEAVLHASYPLLVPPLLTLLDCPSHHIRLSALSMLPTFFTKMGPKVLTTTGLGDVFSDSMNPLLLSFPTITPREEAVEILPKVYESFFALADNSWEINPKTEEKSQTEAREKVKMLEMILRNGIMEGWSHCSETPEIVEILFGAMEVLVTKSGVYAVRSLKGIIPMLTTVLLNPFLPLTRPSLLLSSLHTLQTTILNAWPRIGEPIYGRNIMQALSLCWGSVIIDEKDAHASKRKVLLKVKDEIKITGQLLLRNFVVRGDCASTKGDIQALIDANASLTEMFGGS